MQSQPKGERSQRKSACLTKGIGYPELLQDCYLHQSGLPENPPQSHDSADNRLNTESGCQLIRGGGAMTDSEKERYGTSQMVRYVSGINRPIYPIAFIKYKTAIGISTAVCCFSPAGRKKIHDNLEMDATLFAYLREHPPEGHSLEYADCRLSLLSAQKGKCIVSGEWFLQPDSIVCHMKVPKEQGGQERYSNLVLLHRRYLPLLTDQDAAALKSICNN